MRSLTSGPPLPLAPAHRTFAEAYVAEGEGKKAAILAGYSPRSAGVQAHRLLKREDVRQYIAYLRAKLANHSTPSAESLIERYRRIAMISPMDLLVRDGEVWRWKHPDELTDEQRELIADVSVRTFTDRAGNVTQHFAYKLESRKDARDALARTLGMFRDRLEVQHQHTGKVEALFRFVAEHPETSETTARLRARYGAAGVRALAHDSVSAGTRGGGK